MPSDMTGTIAPFICWNVTQNKTVRSDLILDSFCGIPVMCYDDLFVVDDCAGVNCNGGECFASSETPGAYICTNCPTGFSGMDCETAGEGVRF